MARNEAQNFVSRSCKRNDVDQDMGTDVWNIDEVTQVREPFVVLEMSILTRRELDLLQHSL